MLLGGPCSCWRATGAHFGPAILSDVPSKAQQPATGIVVVLWIGVLVVAIVDGAPWSLHTRLTVGGAILEAVGIGLLALDLVAEPTRRAAKRTAATARGLVARVRAMFSRTRHVHSIDIGAATGTAHVSGGGAVMATGTSSLEEQVAELRRQLAALRAHVDSVDARLSGDVSDLRAELQRTRDDFTHAIRDAIEASKREYHAWRLGGLVIALAGSVMLAVANLT